MTKIGQKRKFDGRTYSWHHKCNTKAQAQADATELRRNRIGLVRVTQSKGKSPNHPNQYNLWIKFGGKK